ncbi:MAG: Holliday junction resolvase RuvX [Candidatus Polarisedimenticolia bacterium]
MGRIMALDVGTVTIGVAISDPLGITAQPVTTLRRVGWRQDLGALQALIAAHEVQRIVVGLPLRLGGERGTAAEEVEAFARKLEAAVQLPVVSWDERLTSVQAERILLEADVSRKRRREVVHRLAAAIILQSYLDTPRETGA